jgi:single-strand DNA-binding protein
MINRVILIGRMTKEPVLRKTQSGASITSFTVACDRRVKAEGQPTADFINCVCWNKVADNTAQYMHKGSLVGVEGRIQTRSYDDQSGRRVYVTEVVADAVQFLEPKGTNSATNTPSYDAGNQGYQSNVNDDEYQIQEDDLPF